MSTGVDKHRTARRMPASETRERILAASQLAFCRAGYDQVGVRELAQAARVDPAIVIRLFGSKEALFRTIADGAFSLEPPFDGPLDGLGERIAAMLTAPYDKDAEGFDEFHFLLRSAASPVAGPILSEALHAGFIDPLARHLGSEAAGQRAALVAACVLGFATLRVALGSPSLEEGRTDLANRLGAVLQACID